MATTIKISDAARAVLARSIITATTVSLPPEQLDRALYVEVDKALKAAGGKWSKKNRVHEFTSDPRAALGLTVEQGVAVNHKQVRQAFYTPTPVARRVAAWAEIASGMSILEPSCGEGALILAALEISPWLEITGYDTDADALDRIPLMGRDRISLMTRDFLKVEPSPTFDRVVMNPPFSDGRWQAHLEHAASLVNEGGRIVAVLPASARNRKGLLDGWSLSWSEDIAGEFAGTSAVVVILVADRK